MKKICIYVLCGLLSFSIISSSYYKSAHAMEWLGGALAFEEALKWCLALLGITATAGMTDAYWDTYGDEFEAYATQNGATQQEVTEWQMKLCEGILDKGSQVWDRFMEWASSLVNNNSSGDLLGITSAVQSKLPNISSISGIPNDYNYTYAVCYRASGGSLYYFDFFQGGSISYVDSSGISYIRVNNPVNLYRSANTNGNASSLSFSRNYNSIVSYYDTTGTFYCYGFQNLPHSGIDYQTWDLTSSGPVNFEGAWSQDIANTGVISSVVPDEADEEVSLPYPGVSDSDNVASKDAYDEIIDAINDGTITQEEGLERIQEILKVIVYDTVTDDVLPIQEDPDTGENKKKDDAIEENKSNMSFSLAGLENVFPFCIPFDIYAFMTLLVADPVAPELDFPIQNVNGEVEEIHVDLSPFEPVAVVVRYVFDFLFIIGLGLLTRSLIGGGSSD